LKIVIAYFFANQGGKNMNKCKLVNRTADGLLP